MLSAAAIFGLSGISLSQAEDAAAPAAQTTEAATATTDAKAETTDAAAGEKATDANGTIAGSTSLLDTIVKRLLKKNINALKIINNTYDYHNVQINGSITWNSDNEMVKIEKDSKVIKDFD